MLELITSWGLVGHKGIWHIGIIQKFHCLVAALVPYLPLVSLSAHLGGPGWGGLTMSVSGLGLGVQFLRFTVWILGFRVLGFEVWVGSFSKLFLQPSLGRGR